MVICADEPVSLSIVAKRDMNGCEKSVTCVRVFVKDFGRNLFSRIFRYKVEQEWIIIQLYCI